MELVRKSAFGIRFVVGLREMGKRAMNVFSPHRRLTIISVVALLLLSCSWAIWSICKFVRKEGLVDYYSSNRVAARNRQQERRQEVERQSHQIERVIQYTANMLTTLGARCYETPKKGLGILDGVDLSQWRGNDRDLPLLRVFLLLEDDNRENQHSNRFELTLAPTATDASLSYLAELTNLDHLSVRHAAISDGGLEHLKKLTRLSHLDLSGTLVTDQCLDRMSVFSELRMLHVEDTKVTIPRIVKFGQSRPNVTVCFAGGYAQDASLDLTGAAATDDILRQFTTLRSFRRIDLRETAVTDAGLAALEGQKITSLWIDKTPITDTGLKHLRGLHTLTVLGLTEIGITDAGLKELEGLENLFVLDLRANPVTDAGLAHLDKLINLRSLALTGTQVTDAGLNHIKALRNLQELYLGGTEMSHAKAAAIVRQVYGGATP
jgi:hypothetical protein